MEEITSRVPIDGIQPCHECGKEPVIERDGVKRWYIHCPDCALSFLRLKGNRFLTLLLWNELMKAEKRDALEMANKPRLYVSLEGPEMSVRNEAIFMHHAARMPMTEIAKLHGVTPSRVAQIIAKEVRVRRIRWRRAHLHRSPMEADRRRLLRHQGRNGPGDLAGNEDVVEKVARAIAEKLGAKAENWAATMTLSGCPAVAARAALAAIGRT